MNWSDITWSAFLQPKELFRVSPPQVWELKPLYVVFLAALLVTAITSFFLRNKVRPEVIRPIAATAWTHFFIGIVLFYLRDSRVPALGMDLWRLVQYIAIAIWLVYFIRHLRTKVSVLSLQEEVAARREKYLPKPKTK